MATQNRKGRSGDDRLSSSRGGSRAELAYQRLLRSILEGALKPGHRVREADIAEQLDISRTPVREALRRLETEGLLTTAAYRGLVVASLDYQAVMELYQMREVLEGTAAGLAARHASEAEIVALREILSAEHELPKDPASHAEQNRRFHNAIYHAAHNRYLLKSLNSFRDAMALLGPTTFSVPGRPTTALEEHGEILDAIQRRDPEAAERCARAHIRMAQQARLKLLNEASTSETELLDPDDDPPV